MVFLFATERNTGFQGFIFTSDSLDVFDKSVIVEVSKDCPDLYINITISLGCSYFFILCVLYCA